MANHKRKRARTAARGHYSRDALRRRLEGKSRDRGNRDLTEDEAYARSYHSGYPRWWDKMFHTRPRRSAVRALEREALISDEVADLIWPLDKKPHQYYW